jgi:hypothetical protein
MKVSEITNDDIYRQLRIDKTYLTDDDNALIPVLKKASEEFVKAYTGLTAEEIDTHEDITIAVLVLISDMYDNRQMYISNGSKGFVNSNRVVDTILGMHCVNLL